MRVGLLGRWPVVLGLLLAGLTACGGSAPERSGAVAAAPQTAEVQLLMFGNSHSSGAGLSERLEAMLRAGLDGRSVAVTLAPGWMFLDERVQHAASMGLMRGRRWNAVVLQAQKYSSSGLYSYSTAEAQALAAEVRQLGALPVMFPEWPRRGVDETARIHALHTQIAAASPACVAPIGQAFDLAAWRMPSLVLHAPDGNHAAPAGAQLAALVLYAAITGRSPLALPDTASDLDAVTEGLLRGIAAEALAANPPRRWCPADPPLLP